MLRLRLTASPEGALFTGGAEPWERPGGKNTPRCTFDLRPLKEGRGVAWWTGPFSSGAGG